jgi:AraC-like DNA-binding protein
MVHRSESLTRAGVVQHRQPFGHHGDKLIRGSRDCCTILGDVSTCDEMLAEARNGPERIATVECFLLRRLRPQRDNLACRVASYLKGDPTLPLQQLASMLSVSTRHLARTFKATFGMTPKRFARLAY